MAVHSYLRTHDWKEHDLNLVLVEAKGSVLKPGHSLMAQWSPGQQVGLGSVGSEWGCMRPTLLRTSWPMVWEWGHGMPSFYNPDRRCGDGGPMAWGKAWPNRHVDAHQVLTRPTRKHSRGIWTCMVHYVMYAISLGHLLMSRPHGVIWLKGDPSSHQIRWSFCRVLVPGHPQVVSHCRPLHLGPWWIHL